MTTPTDQLGRLERVPLRDVWQGEASHFTPWLAREENIALLGDSIGIELEVEAQERNVGPFRADILCKDTATDDWVLIENQLEQTDHTHMGQLMTYAAGLKAVTIVWVAQRFRDEHRAAMDWLNSITDSEFNFFGLEVELWRIGDSAVAPKFNVLSKPNDWSKTVARQAREGDGGSLTESKQLQLDFWTGFREFVLERDSIVTPTKAFPQHWMNMSIGRSGIHLSAIASLWNSASQSYDKHELRVELVLSDTNSKVFFSQLEAQKVEIEAELKGELTWYNPEEKRMCRIYLRREADLNDRSRWGEYHGWLLEKLEALRRAFAGRVRKLETDEPDQGVEE